MNSQFTIRNLLVLIAISSVASWLFTWNWHYAVIWICVIFGIYVGRRSDYPVVLMAICGLMMAALTIMGVIGLNAVTNGYFPFETSVASTGQALSTQAIWMIVIFDAVLWAATAMIFIWFVSVLKRAASNEKQSQMGNG